MDQITIMVLFGLAFIAGIGLLMGLVKAYAMDGFLEGFFDGIFMVIYATGAIVLPLSIVWSVMVLSPYLSSSPQSHPTEQASTAPQTQLAYSTR